MKNKTSHFKNKKEDKEVHGEFDTSLLYKSISHYLEFWNRSTKTILVDLK